MSKAVKPTFLSEKRMIEVCQCCPHIPPCNHISHPARDLQLTRKLTSTRIVGHHPLLRVLGQHKHKSLVHGALGWTFVNQDRFFLILATTWSTILLPAWMTTLVASTPWTVSPSYTRGLFTAVGSRDTLKSAFHGLINHASGKGNLQEENKTLPFGNMFPRQLLVSTESLKMSNDFDPKLSKCEESNTSMDSTNIFWIH